MNIYLLLGVIYNLYILPLLHSCLGIHSMWNLMKNLVCFLPVFNSIAFCGWLGFSVVFCHTINTLQYVFLCQYKFCAIASFQYYLEPPEKLQEAMKEKGLEPDDFFTLKHGESRLIGDDFHSVD